MNFRNRVGKENFDLRSTMMNYYYRGSTGLLFLVRTSKLLGVLFQLLGKSIVGWKYLGSLVSLSSSKIIGLPHGDWFFSGKVHSKLNRHDPHLHRHFN